MEGKCLFQLPLDLRNYLKWNKYALFLLISSLFVKKTMKIDTIYEILCIFAANTFESIMKRCLGVGLIL